jgi:hypothetical protein
VIAAAVLLLAQAAGSPADRLARSGTLAALLPVAAAEETDELVAAHPELSQAEKAALRRIAADKARGGSDRLYAAAARVYATELSPAEIERVNRYQGDPAVRRYRAAEPRVIAAVARAAEGVRFKEEVTAAFCAETGKGCPAGR